MRVIKTKAFYKKILCIFSFILLTLNISFNIFHISNERNLYSIEECLTIGRLVKTQKDGLFSEAGLPGVVYDKNTTLPDSIINDSILFNSHSTRDFVWLHNMEDQYRFYFGWDNRSIPNDYYAYKSQSGGSSLFYSALNLILPFHPDINISILRLISGMLLSICLFLFIGWGYRNFGFISASVLYILIFFSPWIVYMGGSLWWSMWTYYLPFLTLLLLLEKRNKYPSKISENKIFLYLFIAVFIKHLFFGFEYVTTILLAIYPPIIYYYYVEKRKLSAFLIFSFKVGFVSLFAVIAQSFILFYQLSILRGGSILDGINEIIFLYKKRGSFDFHEDISYNEIFSQIFDNFFMTGAFNPNLFLTNDILSFLSFFIIVLVLSLIIYIYLYKRLDYKNLRKYSALFITTFISFICPLSWYIIFNEHSYSHHYRDVIVWYVPTMLYCFVIIGIAISFIFNRLKSHKYIK